jgi:glycopeptide antibiotics resistance protein
MWWGLACAFAGWLLWMTLRSNQTVAADLAPLTMPAAARGIPTRVLIGVAGNIIVFIPLGAALALALRERSASQRLLLAILGGAGVSLVIELVQTAIPTRVTALDDWLLNTAGTAIGAAMGCLITSCASRFARPGRSP